MTIGIGGKTHGTFNSSVSCSDAGRCGNTRCLYKQKTLGVNIWYLGTDSGAEGLAQEELREELGPWYTPKFTVLKLTNCHDTCCPDYSQLNVNKAINNE